MQSFIEFVVRFKEYIVFTTLSIISLLMISNGDTTKIGGFRAYVLSSIGYIEDAFDFIPNPSVLISENKAVRDLNLSLSNELTRSRKSKIENEKLRKMLGFKETFEKNVIPAEVKGKNSINQRNYITINRGFDDSVRVGMVVRTDAGLVGTIIVANKKISLVNLIQNREVSIAGKIFRTSADGIVKWESGSKFKFKNIPEFYDVKKGDQIYTSNYSNKYPSDIPIGEITKVEKDHKTAFLNIEFDSYVNFNTLEQVFVIRELPDPERIDLIKQMEEKLKLLN